MFLWLLLTLLLCLPLHAWGQTPDITSNLELYLRFEEGTGLTAQDSTANNHDGTLASGASWGAGKLGAGAVVLDGTTTGYVLVPGELTQPAAVTLAAWIWPTAFPTTTAEVLTIGVQAAIRVGATSVRGFYWNGTTWPSITVTHALATTGWTHVAYTATAGAQALYVNGVPVGSSNSGAALSYVGQGTDTYLGRLGDVGTTQRFQGRLDEARVYTRVLTPTEIAALAALSAPEAVQVFIGTPTSAEAWTAPPAPLTTLGGTMASPTGVTSVVWHCATCTPTFGPATCTPACATAPLSGTWQIPTLTLGAGVNLVTITAADAGGTAIDTLTVTVLPTPLLPACTHWASPTGGGNGLAPGSPFQIVNFWSVATPGSVLCLLPGTYTGGTSMIQPPVGLAGTSTLPITIQAASVADEGAVFLDGQFLYNPVALGSTNQWFVIQGLTAYHAVNVVYWFFGANNRGKRLIGWHASSGQPNATIFTVVGANTIVEDSAGWGTNARVIFQGSGTASSPGSGYRRAWGEWSDHPTGGTLGGACAQPGVGQFLENLICTVNKVAD